MVRGRETPKSCRTFECHLARLNSWLAYRSRIFLATNWLVIKGGPIARSGKEIVGPHLQLLSQFFIGYKVSFLGSIIGFLYGFAIGTLGGAFIGWIYNWIVNLKKG